MMIKLLILLTLTAANAQAADALAPLTYVTDHVMSAHASVDETLANLYSGPCKKTPGTTPAREAALEQRYFPFAARKLVRFNRCESDVLQKLATSVDATSFSHLVVNDIAMKLPTLRKLYALITHLKSHLDADQREQFDYDAQIARFGFVDASQTARLKIRGSEMSRLSKALEASLKTQKALIATIWRGNDKVMGDYLSSLIKSKVSPEIFKREAFAANPSRPARFFEDAFSFKESVLLPMIDESNKLVKKIDSQYVKLPNGKWHFEPGFGVRNVLVDNMDLVLDTDDGPPELKDMQCHLDYKYAKGDDDLGTTVSVLTMLSGPAIKGLSLALKATKLESFITSSAIAQKVGATFAGGAGAYGFTMTAESAVVACQGGVEHMADVKTRCDATTTAKELSKFESRELDKGNCGLMLVSSVLTETGMSQIGKHLSSIFAENPALKAQITLAQDKAIAAMKLKDQGQVVQSNADTAKDVKDIVDPKKDDDSDSDSDKK